MNGTVGRDVRVVVRAGLTLILVFLTAFAGLPWTVSRCGLMSSPVEETDAAVLLVRDSAPTHRCCAVPDSDPVSQPASQDEPDPTDEDDSECCQTMRCCAVRVVALVPLGVPIFEPEFRGAAVDINALLVTRTIDPRTPPPRRG